MFARKFANWIQFASGTKFSGTGQNFREHECHVREWAAFADGTEHIYRNDEIRGGKGGLIKYTRVLNSLLCMIYFHIRISAALHD